MREFLLVLVAAFVGVAVGKTLDKAPLPPWGQWAVITAVTIGALVLLQGLPAS